MEDGNNPVHRRIALEGRESAHHKGGRMLRFSLKQFAVAALGALSGIAGLQAAEGKSKPNVVVIIADDLGYGDLGFQGGKDIPTPHIDALASQGVRFSSGYVSGPYCSPTRAGLLTSKYQQRFGHEFNPGPPTDANTKAGLSLEEKTLADRFKAAGYKTGLVGKWHLGGAPEFHPTQRGFEEFYGFLGGAHPYFPGSPKNNTIQRGTETVEDPPYLTDAFADEATGYIDRHKADPFFLLLTFNAVHNPQHAKDEHLERFKAIEDERRRTYAGMLTAMDDAIGKVLGKLKDEKLDENTIVAFISDNGGPQANGSLNGALRGQKATTWEGGVRVPFLIKWPAQLAAGTYDKPVIQLDLGPTLLAAVGAPIEEKNIDGVNLLPFLKGEKTDAPHESLYWRFGQQTAIRKGDWKLVKANGNNALELYNLAADIGEKTDLASAEPGKVKELQADWDAWNATLVEPKWKAARAKANPQNQQQPKKKKKAQMTSVTAS
jgi:arylsulfatase A-like enzyme